MKSTRLEELPVAVKKYLEKYALSNWKLSFNPSKKFNNVIVIPVLAEYKNLHPLLESLINNNKKYFASTLVLFVVNNLNDADEDAKEDNKRTINLLTDIIKTNKADPLIIKVNESGLNINFIDAASKGLELPDKDGGVGLARKIGMDLALTILDYQSKEKKILICLDADCTVDNNYLSSIIEFFNNKNINAGYVEYEHTLPENDVEKRAIICYEIFLRYYVLGLQYSNSHFAFPTIGSTMVCDYESYINIGGMNKRKAAEDFYFLEKLAKITRIYQIKNTKVYPSSRGSWRVPFGTGQRVNRFISGTHNEYLLHDPKVFKILKDWNKHFYDDKIRSADEYLSIAESIDYALKNFLLLNVFDVQWNKILNNSKTVNQVKKQKINWFDGFRTLKLIHYLRDTSYPQINMFDAVDRLLVLMNIENEIIRDAEIPSSEIQISYLELLRRL